MTKTCVTCGKAFEPNSNRQRYCSELCRFGTAVCAGCGKTFKRTGNVGRKQRYCSTRCYYGAVKAASFGSCGTCGGQAARGRKFCSSACAAKGAEVRRVSRACERCGDTFATKESLRQRFCSRTCAMTGRNQKGKQVRPEGTRRPHPSGYVMIKLGDAWIFEHRAIMTGLLGRPLDPRERVHHRNGNRADNRPENLELWRLKTKDPAGVRADDYHCPGCRCFEERP